MNSILAFILPVTIFTVACSDPCLPTFFKDGTIIAAEDCTPVDTDTSAASTDGDGFSSTGSPSTGDPSDGSSTGSEPSCNFEPGQTWGPCGLAGECKDEMVTCRSNEQGNMCAPTCFDGACPDSVCGDETSAPMCIPILEQPVCAIACELDGECLDGQTCTKLGCLWPHT